MKEQPKNASYFAQRFIAKCPQWEAWRGWMEKALTETIQEAMNSAKEQEPLPEDLQKAIREVRGSLLTIGQFVSESCATSCETLIEQSASLQKQLEEANEALTLKSPQFEGSSAFVRLFKQQETRLKEVEGVAIELVDTIEYAGSHEHGHDEYCLVCQKVTKALELAKSAGIGKE